MLCHTRYPYDHGVRNGVIFDHFWTTFWGSNPKFFLSKWPQNGVKKWSKKGHFWPPRGIQTPLGPRHTLPQLLEEGTSYAMVILGGYDHPFSSFCRNSVKPVTFVRKLTKTAWNQSLSLERAECQGGHGLGWAQQRVPQCIAAEVAICILWICMTYRSYLTPFLTWS